MLRRDMIIGSLRGATVSAAALMGIRSAQGATEDDRVKVIAGAAGELRPGEARTLTADVEYRIVSRGADGSGITTDPTEDYEFVREVREVLVAEIKQTGGSVAVESRKVGPWVSWAGGRDSA